MIDERTAAEVINAFRAMGPARIDYEGADGMHHGTADAYEVWRALPEGYKAHVMNVLWAVFVKGEAPRGLKSDRFTRNAGQVVRVILENLTYACDQAMEMPILPGESPDQAAAEDRERRAGVVDYLRLKVRYEGTVEALVDFAVQHLMDYASLPPERECFLIHVVPDDKEFVESARRMLKRNLFAADFRYGRRGTQVGYYLTLRKRAA